MENFNFPPVAFIRPDCPDEDHSDSSIDGSGTTTGSSGGLTAAPSTSSESVFQEFSIVGQNLPKFEAIPTAEWLTLLGDKADIRRKFNLREADRLQHLSVQLAENDEPDRAMMHITQALYRCPPNTVLEKAILCQKGELLRRKERFQDAIRHLEHCLRIEGERFSFGTYLCLLRCYKAMGNVRKVRTTLARCATFFNRWKDEFQRYDSQLKNEPDAHMEEMKKEFDLHANCIPMEIVIDKSFRNEPAAQDDYEEEIDFEPYLGYTSDNKILGASVACSLDVEGQSPKLVANRFIPEGSIVLVERPLVNHLEFSKVQCYTCHDVHPHLIPCFNCQGVFYCSYQCQGRDASQHRFECRGYQLLFFPLVNGNLELRMLVRTLDTLRAIILDKPLSALKSHRTAEDLYRLLLDGGAARERFPELFNALLIKLDYGAFRPEDFDALMIKTEKLLSYVKFDGRIKSHYFAQQWKHLDETQLDTFLGGLLLHFCTLTMTKVNRLSYNIPATEDFLGRIQDFITIGGNHEEQPLKQTLLDTLEQYAHNYARGRRGVIDTDKLRHGVQRHLEMLRTEYEDTRKTEPPAGDLSHQVYTRANVKRLWQKQLESSETRSMTAYNSVALNHHQRQRAEDMVSGALLNFFDGYFDHFGEIPMCSKTRTFPNTMRAFYPTAMKLKHSCGPNLFFAMISNGLFVARARFNIQEGEELTLNHGPHYKEAPREERREYLRKIYISCDCIECGQIEDHWIRHQRVRCDTCLFNPKAPEICPQCLQNKELPWETEILIQQLQDIELHLTKNHIPQLVPMTAIGRTAGGLQMSTATGKRKMEMLKFFERLWQMMFVDTVHNVPLFNNLKEQMDCFANEAIRDAIDDVYELLLRSKKIIDTLFPYMSVQVANEYELVVRRTVKYMLPSKFLGGDLRQVHRTTDLARSMIRHAFDILNGHFLYNDDSYYKLLKVEGSLRIIENNLRQTGAQEERDLFFTLMGDVKRQKSGGSSEKKKSGGKKQQVKAAAKATQPEKPPQPSDSYESKSAFLRNSLPNGDLSASTNGDDHENTVLFINEDDLVPKVQEKQQQDQEVEKEAPAEAKKSAGNVAKSEKSTNVKRKETGAIPKPSRTTKHHRKV